MARKKGQKKSPSDLSAGYIIKKIAPSSDLTVSQITEALNLYTSYVANFLLSDACPEDVKISIPSIGKILFKKRLGLKTGSTYKSPYNFGKTKDEHGNPIMETITVEEDMPDYLRIWVDVSPTLQSEMRRISEDRWRKKHGK